ncbi:hypothetical protein FPZ43_11360 [Mucilaginibacter pallidiroseus]|uniref:Uncharacterized protein n=1 Tax=Mucilaginibacter pallidiroseus TaxID=2599295 RepID=A0A563UBW2_9SPHI|nr:hypothetical protein [Mucilaginibacter pallidiroseus]TWR28861.1 hypothetical protein FPZ43_11360 [Mucilaginibacter pallidiroseus]
MKKLNNRVKPQLSSAALKCIAILGMALMLNSGCKKDDVNQDKEFGEGRLTVQCAGQCNISYTVADKVTKVTIDKTIGTYTLKYQRNFLLSVDVTAADVDQAIVVNVYSREGKQIYHNDANKKVNEVWSAKVLVP